jgi:hypothetical protein
MTSRGYRAAKNRPLSDRAVRDQVLGDDIERLHAANFGVYGVRKTYRLMKRRGWSVGAWPGCSGDENPGNYWGETGQDDVHDKDKTCRFVSVG